MQNQIIITRDFLASRIDSLLNGDIPIPIFGKEMVAYLAFRDRFVLEPDYENLLKEVLSEFMDMHDVDQGNVGYQPYVPSHERLCQLKEMLLASERT